MYADTTYFKPFLAGTLLPVYQALRLLGNIVVPASSLIVGARLYAFHTVSTANSFYSFSHT